MGYDDFDGFDGELDDNRDLIERYNQLWQEGKFAYFDLEEFEILIEYFLSVNNKEKLSHLLKNIDKIYPGHPTVYLIKALVYSFNGKKKKARKMLKLADKAFEHLADIDKGVYFQRRGDVKLLLNEYIPSMLDFMAAYKHGFSDLQYIAEQLADLYSTLFDLNPGINEEVSVSNTPLTINELVAKFQPRNYYYFIDENPEQAKEIIKLFAKENPLNQNVWYFVAYTLEKTEEYDEALEALDYALALKPAFIKAILLQAQILRTLGLYERAIDVLKDVHLTENSKGEVYYELAENYLQMADYNMAVEYFHAAIANNTKIHLAYFALGVVHTYHYRDFALAVQYVKKAMSIDAQDLNFPLLLADIMTMKGDYETAEKYYRQVLELQEPFFIPDTILNYAELFAKQNLYDKAINILDTHTGKDMFNEIILGRRFNSLWKSGRHQEALDLLNALFITGKEKILKQIISYDPALKHNMEFIRFIESYSGKDHNNDSK